MKMAQVPLVVAVLMVLMLAGLAVSSSVLRFSDNCPKQYYIVKPDRSTLNVQLFASNQSYCYEMNEKAPNKGYHAQADLKRPRVTPTMIGPKPMAQIDLFLQVNQDGKYPLGVYLEMTTYLRGPKKSHRVLDSQQDTMCIFLNISDSIGDPYWDPIKISFTCMELVDDSYNNYLLAMKMWSLPRYRRSQMCRQRRAVGGHKTCDVRCSKEVMYPITIAGENEYQLCACADKSRINSTITTKGDNQQKMVNLEGLPPFIGNILVVISNEKGHQLYNKTLASSSIREGKVEFELDRQLKLGNYSLMIDGKCQFSREASFSEKENKKDKIDQLCAGNGKDVYAVDFFSVEEVKQDEPSSFLLVAMVIVGVVLVTCVVFLVWTVHRRRSKSRNLESSQGPNNQAVPVGTQTHTQTLTRTLGDKMGDAVEDDIHKEQSSPLLEINHKDDNLQTSEMTLLYTQTSTESPNHHHHHKQTVETMILHHPDNVGHISCVRNLVNMCHNRGVNLKSVDAYNWRDFAEAATDEYRDIVIVLSEKLNQMLRSYKDGIDREPFRSLMKERHHEYTPCIVMDKIRMRVHERGRDFSLHVVTMCDSEEAGDYLIGEFLQAHDYLKRTNHCKMYNFTSAIDGDEPQFISLVDRILSMNINPLTVH